MQITRQQILAIMPMATRAVDKYLPYLNTHMNECGITSRERICHFADGLRKTFPKYFKTMAIARSYERHPQQIANRVYANRYGNGNEASGDGWRYRGRGLIQYTFRDNYKEYAKWCGYDVEKQPELLAQPKGAVRSACHYYQSRGCNELADGGGTDEVFRAIRKKVNGGTNGLAAVKLYYQRAKQAIRN